jgi:DNA-binding MarR family transcriptional regulator
MYSYEGLQDKLVVFGGFFAIANRLQTAMDAVLPELTAKQWFLISQLELFDGPPTLQELSSACSTTHQNTRQLVNKLAEKGFVKTTVDASDKRTIRIVMQPKCAAWGKSNELLANAFLDKLFQGMDESEIGALRKSMEGIFERLGGSHG